jgi:hypothetical protein
MWECATLGLIGGDVSQVHPGAVNSLASSLGDKLDEFEAASVWGFIIVLSSTWLSMQWCRERKP